MGTASYISKNIKGPNSWLGFEEINYGITYPYVAGDRFLQLNIHIDRASSEYISSMEVEYELFTSSGAMFGVTPYLLVKADQPFQGLTANEVYNEATELFSLSPMIVDVNGTGYLKFTLDFTSEKLSPINKPAHSIYLLISTDVTSSIVMTSTIDQEIGSRLRKGPVINAEFGGSVPNTVTFYDSDESTVIYTYNVNSGESLTIPAGLDKSPDTEIYELIPRPGEGTLPSGIKNGSQTVSTDYIFENWYCQEDKQYYYPYPDSSGRTDTITPTSDIHMISQYNSYVSKNTLAPSGGIPTKSSSDEYSNIYYNPNYTGHNDPVPLSYSVTTTYLFNGWYTSSTGGELISNHIFSSDSYVYPHFDSTPWITYSSVTLPDLSGTRSDYIFKGYAETSTATEATISAGSYTPEDTLGKTFYAVWELENSVTVTFSVNYGSTPSFSSRAYIIGGTYSPLPTTTRSGYSFNGWFSNDYGTITEDKIVEDVPNFTVYDRWVNNYTVTLNPDGGSVSPTSITVAYSWKYGAITPLPTPTKSGYNFDGWYYNESLVDNDTIVNVQSNHTLIARWTEQTISIIVTYNKNNSDTGSTNPSPSSIVCTVGNKYVLPATNPTRPGYIFTGWASSPSDGSTITSDTTVTIRSNHDVYAQWKGAYSYRLSFMHIDAELSPSTFINPIEILNSSNPTGIIGWDPPVVTKEGYIWVGWSENSSGTPVLPGGTSLSSYSITGSYGEIVNKTLFAAFTEPIPEHDTIRVYVSGEWKEAIPYVYANGKWNEATAYIYSNGWKKSSK